MSAIQRFLSGLSGRKVGTDSLGNAYFESRGTFMKYGRTRRWVVYAGAPEASAVPPEWHGWLHHTTDRPIDVSRPLPWMKPHRPNLTGTSSAYRPDAPAVLAAPKAAGGKPGDSYGSYEAWTPGG